MRHATAALGLLTAAVLAPACPTQGVLPLDGPYHFGQIGAFFDQPLGCSTFGPVVYSDRGTILFATNGTFTLTDTIHEVCAGANATSTGGESGAYTVDETGVLTMDFDLGNPGTDISDLLIRADGSAVVHSRDAAIEEAFVVIALRGSTGQSNASLSGGYHVARLANANATSLSIAADLGVITFDGGGSWTEAGNRQSVATNGATSNAPYAASGSYTVAADGQVSALQLGVTSNGGIAADGSVFFWTTGSGSDVAMTIGVRRGSGLDIDALTGIWGFGEQQQELGVSATLPDFQTGFGSFAVAATGQNTGSFTGTVLDVDTTPSGTTSQTSNLSGTVAVGLDGALQFVDGQSFTTNGAVDPRGSVWIAHPIDAGVAGLAVGVRRPNPPVRYGTPTPGTGGFAPDVTFAPAGGFPIEENFTFGLRMFDGRGGANAAFLLSFGTSTGFPFFGGTILVDPLTIFAAPPRTLSGTTGAARVGEATLTLPLPLGTDGAVFYVQAIVLDPNTPGGIAMGQGVCVAIGR